MNLRQRINSFAKLGEMIPELIRSHLPSDVHNQNNWFTHSEVARALNSWSALLTDEKLTSWTEPYRIPDTAPIRNVLVITAGNIPLVGFHDFLSVLITGNRFTGKLSSRDNLLIINLAQELIRIEPGFSEQIQFQNLMGTPDAVIATGSDNSARYFRKEYGQIPHIIRKNRSSAAVLDQTETSDQLNLLAADVLEFYGLGCRSVSHLFLPAGSSPEILTTALSNFSGIDPCEPYSNNLRYQKARLSMLGIPFIDVGQALLTESEQLHSPVGVVHYSYYPDTETLLNRMKAQETEIQCLVGHHSLFPDFIPFGSAQKPELWQYADHTDTIEFLINKLPNPRT